MIDSNPKKIVLLAAREVTAARTGRIAVLETAVHALQSAGHEVEVISITGSDGSSEWMGCKVHRVSPPAFYMMPVNVLRNLARGRSLNEALFDAPRVRAEVAEICACFGADVVVADNIRTWDAAQATGLPVIIHLDDLLSERYSSEEFRENNDSVFGYFSDEIPSFARPVLEKVVKRLLNVEARLSHRREIAIAQTAAVTALTSAEEAKRLAERAGVDVVGLPMAVPQRDRCLPSSNPGNSAVFLGVMHYGPNMGALRYYRDEVLPKLKDRQLDIEVVVIGKSDAEQQAEFAGTPIRFMGYVEDLHAELSKHRMFLSPVQSGTGVKTKVLDAFSVGLPIVASPLGVAGIPSAHGDEYLVGHDADEFASHMEYLAKNPDLADAVGQGGYDLLGREMSPQKVYDDWYRAVQIATGELNS